MYETDIMKKKTPNISNDQLRTSHKYILGYILYSATKQMQKALWCFLFKLF